LEAAERAGRRAPLFFAGCITGVEGYTESAATGILAGLNAARRARGEAPVELPRETMIGALTEYLSHGPEENFQPMNANLGLLPPIEPHIKNKRQRQESLIARGLGLMRSVAAELGRSADSHHGDSEDSEGHGEELVGAGESA
jgi:methylenetetrahydrofolate--tRNA-(uracil-5-)-methyltransferase